MYTAPPPNEQPLTLFEYSVRQALSLGLMTETNTHATWATLIFKYEKGVMEIYSNR